MIYTSQYDDMLDIDSLDRGINQVDLDRVLENNDFSYVMDLDDIC